MSKFTRQDMSVSAFPPLLEPCSQCKELLEVIELWKQAFRKSASHFLSVQRELIKAEAAAHRLGEIVSEQFRVEAEWETPQSRHTSKRRKGRSECSFDDPVELQQMLYSALTVAGGLCKGGAVSCFETRKQPSIRRKEASNSPKVVKRHSWNEDPKQKDVPCGGADGVVSGAANGQKRDSTVDVATTPNATNSCNVRVVTSDEPHPSSAGPRPFSGGSRPPSGGPRPSSEVESTSSVRSSSCASEDGSQTDHSNLAQRLQQLEGEKNRLLDKLEKQHLENRKVRQSLGETLSDLESHEIQLALAMQDLVVATSEIKKASTMREQLNQLEREKEQLLHKMEKVEDESSCVKASLVQLLQEKSASNRHLQTENMHLRGILKRRESGESLTRLTSDSSAADESLVMSASLQPGMTNGDTASVLSSVDMMDLPVHKVGYLTKEGGRVKSWKRRLFVLNSVGLFYYKADDPAGCIKLSEMSKVGQCRGKHNGHPNMIAITTQQRTYYAEASSQEEMQSWIGMLESLRQHHQQSSSTAPHLQSTLTASPSAGKKTTSQSKSPRLGVVEELTHSPSQKRAQRRASPVKRMSDAPPSPSLLVSGSVPSTTGQFSVFTTNSAEPLSPSEIPQNASEAPPRLTVVPPNTGEVPPSTSAVPQSTNEEVPPNTGEVPPNTNAVPQSTNEELPPNTGEVPPNANAVPQTTNEVPLPGPGERQSVVSEDSRSSAVFSTDDTADSSSAHSHSTPV